MNFGETEPMNTSVAAGGNIWQTSVDELVAVFQRSLISILPVMNEARIPWREGESYDDWDRIVSALYESILVDSIRWGLKHEAPSDVVMPKYETLYGTYLDLSYLRVMDRRSNDGELLAFYALASQHEPFDAVRCRTLDANRAVLETDRFVLLPLAESQFELHWRIAAMDWKPVRDLQVAL